MFRFWRKKRKKKLRTDKKSKKPPNVTFLYLFCYSLKINKKIHVFVNMFDVYTVISAKITHWRVKIVWILRVFLPRIVKKQAEENISLSLYFWFYFLNILCVVNRAKLKRKLKKKLEIFPLSPPLIERKENLMC